MKNLSDINVVKSLLSRHGFQFSKALGQNFLINPEICPKMATECGADQTKGVIEVGPGFGVLTRELAARANKVVAIELDKRLPAVLAETLRDFNNVKVVQADVMEVDLHQLIQDEFSGLDVLVCANLPYYITSPVIMKLLEEKLPVESLTVMVQKEAAERLCAQPGTRECGAVSAAVQYYAEPEILFEVSRGSFMPAPNVDSAVIQLHIRKEPPVDVRDEALFFRVIRAAFAQRRKTAVNSISNTLHMSKQQVTDAFEQAGVRANSRAEALTLPEFAAVVNQLAD